MANAKEIRATLDKKLAKLSKASESVEAKLKSAADHVTTGALALEKVLAKEIAPNVSAKLKAIEKVLAAYKKAAERELAKLTKAYDRELANSEEPKSE